MCFGDHDMLEWNIHLHVTEIEGAEKRRELPLPKKLQKQIQFA